MAEEKIYLELSEDDGGSHKFYEVIIEETKVSIRYGRIGDKGRTQVKEYPTAEKAKADADKKIREKKRKGYAEAVMGIRQKRPITRRQIASSKSTAKRAPVLWNFASGSPAFGIFIDEDRGCFIGTEGGQIYHLDLAGQVQNQYKLPNGVKCLVADEDWLYAGCDDGKVYDLTGKVPRVAYEIALNIDIFWLDINDGILGVSDANGQITTINHEEESQWSCQSKGNAGWMVRCDEIGVYHGHSEGVTMYDWEDGKQIWQQKTPGSVLFGWQEETTIYTGNSDRQVYAFSKQGKLQQTYQCDAAVYSCATAEDGKYIFAGDNYSSIYCFNATGERLWKLGTGCGSAYSMQFFGDRLYIVTTNGSLACIDASETAIASAQEGNVPDAVSIKLPSNLTAIAASSDIETTSDRSSGVLVKCIKEGNKLRVRAIDAEYNNDWNVQFPKELREENVSYIVDEIRPSSRGGFYRAYGNIKKLIC